MKFGTTSNPMRETSAILSTEEKKSWIKLSNFRPRTFLSQLLFFITIENSWSYRASNTFSFLLRIMHQFFFVRFQARKVYREFCKCNYFFFFAFKFLWSSNELIQFLHAHYAFYLVHQISSWSASFKFARSYLLVRISRNFKRILYYSSRHYYFITLSLDKNSRVVYLEETLLKKVCKKKSY